MGKVVSLVMEEYKQQTRDDGLSRRVPMSASLSMRHSSGMLVTFITIRYREQNLKVWKIQTCNNILMRNRTRLSIDDQVGMHITKTHSRTPLTPNHPLMRKKSSEILSIHQDLQNSTELARPFPALYPQTGLLHKKKHSQRYKPNIDSEQNDHDNKLEVGFMSSTENNRITFCKSSAASAQILAFRAINRDDQIAASQSQSSKKSERQFLKSQFRRNESHLQRQLSQKSASHHELEKAVIDLQEHNKNIMLQTKQTVMNFEAYIEQLLESNQQLQANLLEYENYIEMLENERSGSLEKQKEREIELQKTVRENITIKKELSLASACTVMEEKLKAEVELLKQKLKECEQQVTSKDQLIKLLQDSVVEKQSIIKKMTQFNNEMCLQILNLKTNGIETMSDIQNQSNRWLSRNKSSQNFRINNEELQNNIVQLQNENAKLKEQNAGLEQKIRQMTLDDQIILPYIDDQINIINTYSQKISQLTKKLKSYQKSSNHNSMELYANNSFNGKLSKGVIVKNKQNSKYPELNGKNVQICQAAFQHNFELSEIYPKGSGKLQINFYPFEQDNSQVSRAILKKIDHLIEVICPKLKKSGQLSLSKKALENIMKTIATWLSNAENDRQLDEIKENSKNNNILFNLDDQEESNFTSIIRKNEEILTRAAEIKKKLKGHMSLRINQNDEILSGRNASVDRFDFSLNDHSPKGLQNSQNSLYLDGQVYKKRDAGQLAQIFSQS